jgi:rhodanese-related sulfurtransferase
MADGSVTQITPGEVQAILDAGAAFIDVREQQETSAGRAPGVTCMPMQTFDVGALPSERSLVLICRTGRRSDAVAAALAGMGFTTFNVAGGMTAWASAGLPVVAQNGAAGVVL